MDAIRSYLESMFAQLPNTEAVKKAKAELLQMMEDKYSELIAEGKSQNEAVGTVIAEFGNLEELADSLGIGGVVHSGEEKKERRTLSLQQVKDYLSDAGRSAHSVALGVLFCITCCVPVITLSAFAEVGYLSDQLASAVGVAMLFIFIATGVALFVLSGSRMNEWKFLKTQLCSIDMAGAEYVSSQKKAYMPTHNVFRTIGIVLCILCVVPVSFIGTLNLRNDDFLTTLGAATIFVFVGAGVFLLVSSSKKIESFNRLLMLNDVTTISGSYANNEGKTYSNKTVAVIMSIFWPSIVCLYFIISFATKKWQYTWLIFVIGGVVSMLIKNLYATSSDSEKTYSSDREPKSYTNKTAEAVMSVFWPTVTCVYLIWSFLTFDWHFTWIIWPIAAVASTLIKNIYGKD